MVQYTIYTTVDSHPKFGPHIDWIGRRSLALESISIGNIIYSCWDCFDTYQCHLGHESWSGSAFSCVNLTSSKELRKYLNAFCYGELGSYTVFHTAGVAVLEYQRWTGFLWSRKLFIAWLKVCMCMFGREKGTTDYSGSVSNVWEFTDFPWIAKFVFISLIFLGVHVVSLERVHHST